MRVTGRIILSIVFIPFFFLLLLFSSIQFQILNSNFLIHSFQKHQVYAQIPSFLETALNEQETKKPGGRRVGINEGENYRAIVQNLKPDLIQEVIEKNVTQLVNFLNGESKDIVFYLPAAKLGIPDLKNIEENISLRKMLGERMDNLFFLNGLGKISFGIWFVLLLICGGLLKVILSFGNSPKDKFLGFFLIFISLTFLGICTLLKLFLNHLTTMSGQSKSEPSQALIGMFSMSVLPDIVQTWMIVAGIIGILGVFFLVLKSRIESLKK